jgi:hypothetical protein
MALGHWLGENGDVLGGWVEYRWSTGLSTRLYGLRTRKGAEGPQELHYSFPWKKKFLEGPLFERSEVGVKVRCQLWQPLLLSVDASLQTQTNDLFPEYPSYRNAFMLQIGLLYNIFN